MNNYRPDKNKRHVGILGGTFDPIHYGHLVIAEEVRATLQLAEIVFVPAGQPPHKPGKIVTAAGHRLAMLQLALASNPFFTVSRVDLERPGPSYTVETLRLLQEQWGEQTAIYFVIGGDSLEELHTWHDPAGILKHLDYLVAVTRPGHQDVPEYRERLETRLPGIKERLLIIPAPQLDISATDLRLRLAEGRPIKYQTPESVEHYIAEHKLYSAKSDSREQVTSHDTNAL